MARYIYFFGGGGGGGGVWGERIGRTSNTNYSYLEVIMHKVNTVGVGVGGT